MGVHSSITISREKAEAIIDDALHRDDDLLRVFASIVMEKYTFRNCARIVEHGEPNQDDDDGLARLYDWEPLK